MKKRRLRIFTLLLMSCLLFGLINVGAEPVVTDTNGETVSDLGVTEGSLSLDCKSAVLIEATTGTVLYRQNCDEALPPASVTKVMTLLLVMEAIDSGTVRLDDMISVSANAASMGGSQVYLKEGEQMRVEDLLKSVVIASANDAAVALAEYIAGNVTAFVDKMNTRAAQLGMKNTVFENVTGLDDTAQNHLISAYDIALMSAELIRHETILQYSSIWMDTIRDGAFGLTNTNRLVRYYPGCTGLKTGSTSKAGFCVSVTAERDGFSLVCVIMGAESRDARNAIATQLLDWGFANYGIYNAPQTELEPIFVIGGKENTCAITAEAFSVVLPKSKLAKVEAKVVLPDHVPAPVKEGDRIGSISYIADGGSVGECAIYAKESVGRIGFFDVLKRVMARFLLI